MQVPGHLQPRTILANDVRDARPVCLVCTINRHHLHDPENYTEGFSQSTSKPNLPSKEGILVDTSLSFYNYPR